MKLRKHRFLWVALTLLLCTSVRAQLDETNAFYWADTVTVVGKREVTLPTINAITMKMPLSIQSTPASVGVVTRAVFENQNGRVLSDALYNVSGINVQSQFGVHDYFIIRGFDSISSGLVLTDGTAEPEATFYHLYNIQSVEVLKGPGAFLYGGNPMSGTINLNRKQPIFANFLNASGSYGKFQSYEGTIDFGLANQTSTVAFRLNGLVVGSENYRDEKDSDVLAINPALTWRISHRSNLNINFEYVDSQYTPDAGIPLMFDLTGATSPTIPNISRTFSYQPKSDFSDQKIARFKARFDTQISESVKLQNKFYFSDQDWQSESTLVNGAFQFPQVGELVRRSNSGLDDRQKIIGNQVELLSDFKTGGVEHTLLTGF
ncbi:MAG: TonB-dependent receptor, partial [bacterium]